MRYVTGAEARANLRELLDEVEGTHERVVITRHGTPSAILLAIEDLEALEETVEVLSDAGLMRAIAEGEADVSAGRTATLDQVRQDLAARQRERSA